MGYGAMSIFVRLLESNNRQVSSPGRFIAEWTDLNAPPPPDVFDHWSMFFDGSLNINGAGAGILFISPNKDKLRYVISVISVREELFFWRNPSTNIFSL